MLSAWLTKYRRVGYRLAVVWVVLGLVAGFYLLSHSSEVASYQHIARGVAYLQDATDHLTVDQVRQLPSVQWQTNHSDRIWFGLSDHPYWLQFSLQQPGALQYGLLVMDFPLLDKVDVWLYQQQKLVAHYHQGDTLPFDQRVLKTRNFVFPVPFQPSLQTDVVMRLAGKGTIKAPLSFWSPNDYLIESGKTDLLLGLFYGFLAAMAIANLFYFLTTKSLHFFVYSAFTLSLGLMLASFQGITFKFLWPNNVWFQIKAISIFANASGFFALVFTYQLLEVSRHSRRLALAMRGLAIVFALCTILCFLLPYRWFVYGLLPIMGIGILLLYFSSIWLWIKGVPLARLYTLAWTFLLGGGLVATLESLSLASLPFDSTNMLMVGAGIETLLFAWLLALNYNQQRQSMFDAQQHNLEQERQLRAAQERINEVQKQASEEMEYKVGERTLELEIALRELAETNRELEKKNTIDGLTGIRNRRYFDKKYIAEIRRSRREQTELAIAMVDIDHFKTVNDKYGHLVGDECIRFVAEVLKEHFKRPSDEVCRYGGEEFAVILPNTRSEGALSLVDGMRDYLQKCTIPTSAGSMSLTVSAGVSSAVIQQQMADLGLLESADKALYQAKNGGRNRVEYLPLNSVDNQGKEADES